VPFEKRWRDPEPYQAYRQPLQAKWRPPIMERDKKRCRNCQARPTKRTPDVQLDMAHITDAVAFVRAAGDHTAVTFSYRWDNLYMLCHTCHAASHRFKLDADMQERRWQVQTLEATLRKLRGWSSPYAVIPPHMLPERLRPRRSFHDVIRLSPLMPFPTYDRYASDGGSVLDEDREDWPSMSSDWVGPTSEWTQQATLGI
jgi:hypothetical protein